MAVPATRRRRAAQAPASAADAPLRVYVRMYRGLIKGLKAGGWLGDCFLIRIEQGTMKSHVLIDCGILTGSEAAPARMKAVTDDIVAVTGGTLDLLVVTHEHWDHISGFSQAQDVFLGSADGKTQPKLTIKKIWMAWTEKRGDKLADDLDKGLKKRSEAFAKLAKDVATNPPFGADVGTMMGGLEAFIGPLEDNALAVGGKTLTGRAIMERLKGVAPTEYREPGETLPLPTAVPLRAHVLGPPRTAERLFKDQPSEGVNKETYLATPTFNEDLILRFADGDPAEIAGDSPFADRYCTIGAADVEDPGRLPHEPGRSTNDDTYRWLKMRYFDKYPPCRFGDGSSKRHEACQDMVCGADQSRRRIDGDWLAAAGPLALKLDSDTNNTSLVLAIELPDDRVMLFAADAQVGNWLSWYDQDYDGGDGKRVTASDLLGRTALYKVGHHGSHNATLRGKGLELMTRTDLVAFIPTDEAFGRTRPGDWKMPNEDVNTALIKQTQGRIIRNDRTLTPSQAQTLFGDRLQQTPLFLEYRVHGPA